MIKKEQVQQIIAELSKCSQDSGSRKNVDRMPLNQLDRPKVPDVHELQKRNEDLRRRKIENDISENELALKKGIYCWVKWVVTIYLSFVAVMIMSLIIGLGSLSDNVIIALLTTTTINILGLPYMIIKSLFPSNSKEKQLLRNE